VYASTTLAWKALDCDGDGLTNKEEIDPNNDGIPDLNTTNPQNQIPMVILSTIKSMLVHW
jgi:hypothetical protein